MCLQPQKCLSNCYLCMCSFPYPLSLFHLFDVGLLLLLLLNFTSTFFAALHLIGTKLFQHFFKRTPSQVLFEFVCLCVDICGWVTSFLRERGWWEAKYIARASGPWKRHHRTFIEFTQICTTRVKCQIETVQIFLIHFFPFLFFKSWEWHINYA